MRRLRFLLLAAVIALGVVMAAYLLRNLSLSGLPLKVAVSPLKGEVQLQGIHLVHQDNGATRWELHAKSAEMSRSEQVTVLEEVELTFLTDEATTYRISGKKGIFNRATGNMELSEDVRVSTDKGYTLETQSLRYDATLHHISTNDRVTAHGDGLYLEGGGLDFDVDARIVRVVEGVVARLQ